MLITKDDLKAVMKKPAIHSSLLTAVKSSLATEPNLLQQIKELKAALATAQLSSKQLQATVQSQAQQHCESIETLKQ